MEHEDELLEYLKDEHPDIYEKFLNRHAKKLVKLVTIQTELILGNDELYRDDIEDVIKLPWYLYNKDLFLVFDEFLTKTDVYQNGVLDDEDFEENHVDILRPEDVDKLTLVTDKKTWDFTRGFRTFKKKE